MFIIKKNKSYSEEYTSIELDIIPKKGKYGKFININEEDKKYFHIYFKKKEIENTSLYKDDNVSKICLDELKLKIKRQFKNFKEAAFKN